MRYFSLFPKWLWQVLKKGIWALGFLPQVLDYIATYVPDEYIPSVMERFIESGGNWQLTLILVVIGLLVSAFLVNVQFEEKLAAYEYQEPKYGLNVSKVTTKICSKDNVHIDCVFTMTNLTLWAGNLDDVGVKIGEPKLAGLEKWELTQKPRKLPREIPNPSDDFGLVLHAKVNNLIQQSQKDDWCNIQIPLYLKISFYTPPIGYVSKLLYLDVPVNLGSEYDNMLKSFEN